MTKYRHVHESILDDPRDTLCPEVWNLQSNAKPILIDEAQAKVDRLIQFVQNKFEFEDLSVFIIGSICSNSYSDNSDIDIDFCAPDVVDNDDEEAVKEFGWKFKSSVVKDYLEKNPEEAKIGSHPIEVYFEPNQFQCFMSVGCYNVLKKKWEVGPDIKDLDFDPVSEYYAAAMKQTDKIVDDIRTQIFELYETAFACKKSNDLDFKHKMQNKMKTMIDNAVKLYDSMKKVRSNFQKPCKSKEEALKRRNDRRRHVVDAAFKFLDKFGYMQMLKDFTQLKYDIDDAKQNIKDVDNDILSIVSSNMQLKHLQDSENEQDKKFLALMQEAEGMLEESASGIVKLSFIAALMAVSSFLPVDALSKNLSKAKKQNSHLTVNSPETKEAIAASAEENEMVGPMSKTNVINALARCLWAEGRGEGKDGREAIASVIVNRTGRKPEFIVDVIKQPAAFSYLSKYKGGWTDATYQWFLPWKAISGNPNNKAIWDECNKLALDIVDGKFKSTIGDRNAYMNKDTAEKKNVESWGKKCTYKVGSHHFGYLKDRDPKYVIPGTYTAKKKANSAKQEGNAKFVVVKSGDSLSKIAKASKIPLKKLLKLNKDLKNPNMLNIGQKIRIA